MLGLPSASLSYFSTCQRTPVTCDAAALAA
nr:MAG TPA: hypothetical protein [Caudoviricetes sp.]